MGQPFMDRNPNQIFIKKKEATKTRKCNIVLTIKASKYIARLLTVAVPFVVD